MRFTAFCEPAVELYVNVGKAAKNEESLIAEHAQWAVAEVEARLWD